ncbi:MAG: hypothetical protein ACOH2I_07450 [Pseudomonas sp.]
MSECRLAEVRQVLNVYPGVDADVEHCWHRLGSRRRNIKEAHR